MRFPDDFEVSGNSKNEQKCGSVCSKSLFGVRNITSDFGAFWAGFWEGLGSILGGFWSHVGAQKRSKTHVESKLIFKMRFEAEKCRFQAEKADFFRVGGMGRGPV